MKNDPAQDALAIKNGLEVAFVLGIEFGQLPITDKLDKMHEWHEVKLGLASTIDRLSDRALSPDKSRNGSRVVASAIRLDSVTYTGLRHHQIIMYLVDAGFSTPIHGEQGFIDDTGRFLSRKEAANLALASGQVSKLIAPGMGLDSADVFPRSKKTAIEPHKSWLSKTLCSIRKYIKRNPCVFCVKNDEECGDCGDWEETND
jgi:hypothetical protein